MVTVDGDRGHTRQGTMNRLTRTNNYIREVLTGEVGVDKEAGSSSEIGSIHTHHHHPTGVGGVRVPHRGTQVTPGLLTALGRDITNTGVAGGTGETATNNS